MSHVHDDETIARLIFYPHMIKDGKLQTFAFPMDELLAIKCKDGVSVDRYNLLSDPDHLLRQKAKKNANPTKGRTPYGFCLSTSKQIRAIKEKQGNSQAFEIFQDEIKNNNPPEPWDRAHALIRKFDSTYTRAHLRGSRDYLLKIFSDRIEQFQGLLTSGTKKIH